MTIKRVSVGLDGSPESSNALQWAHDLAYATGASLRGISTWEMPMLGSMFSVTGATPSQAFMASHCAEHLDIALAETNVVTPIEKVVHQGDPGAFLVEESATADLVVVGRTGNGRKRGVARVAEVLLGSTARHCAHHAHGPIAVVPGHDRWVNAPMVAVGVDGSLASIAALRWAAEQLPPDATIHAIRGVAPAVDALLPFDHGALDRVIAAADLELIDAIKTAVGPLGLATMARVKPLVLVEDARNALIDPGFAPDLVVVGERSARRTRRRILGSVADHTLRHAPCAVIIIPAPDQTP